MHRQAALTVREAFLIKTLVKYPHHPERETLYREMVKAEQERKLLMIANNFKNN